MWQGAGPAWTLALGGTAAQRFVGLDAWQGASSLHSHPELVTDPDAATVWADPDFADEAAGDYRPESPGTTGTGRFGDDIGALQDGETIGVPDP